MKTVSIQIGNSDDKLTQREWSDFVSDVRTIIEDVGAATHFFACSPGDELWQNAAWVIACSDEQARLIKAKVAATRARYRQDSVAWTEGETQFV